MQGSSFATASSPPPPPHPQDSAGINCTPIAPPRYAGDALLTLSGQDMHTELTLSRVVGGAVNVKLKNWQQKINMKAAPEQDIQRNIRAVIGLCQTASVQPPPPFEFRFFATVMCQYTGDATCMFSHVTCHESKAHIY